jgi:hypothetical protein
MIKSTERMKMERDLGFAHLGNGISVYDRLHEENNDYVAIAHIDNNRKISFLKKIAPKYINQIKSYALTADPAISFSQSQNVFIDRPPVSFDDVYRFIKKHYKPSRFEERNGDIWGKDYSVIVARGHFNDLVKNGIGFISSNESKDGVHLSFDIEQVRNQIGERA